MPISDAPVAIYSLGASEIKGGKLTFKMQFVATQHGAQIVHFSISPDLDLNKNPTEFFNKLNDLLGLH